MPVCNVPGCDARSAYLLAPEGDLCEKHAVNLHPVEVRLCRTVLGRPAAAKGGDD